MSNNSDVSLLELLANKLQSMVRQDHICNNSLESYIRQCRSKAAQFDNSADFSNFLSRAVGDGFIDIWMQLYAHELFVGTYFTGAPAGWTNNLMRGEGTYHRMMSQEQAYVDASSALEKVFDERDILCKVETVCEIGTAWGATVRHLVRRFAPREYQAYELDGVFLEKTKELFGITPMNTDGETLSSSRGDSIDIAICHNVFFFVPVIKIWSYLCEMARVVRPGGVVVFNLHEAEQYVALGRTPASLLRQMFPCRMTSLVPRCIIDSSFPSAHFDLIRVVTLSEKLKHAPYYVYRKKNGGELNDRSDS